MQVQVNTDDNVGGTDALIATSKTASGRRLDTSLARSRGWRFISGMRSS